MLQAYIDGSRAGDNSVFVMAGYISTRERWEKFSDDWEKALESPGQPRPTLKRFKMKEMKRDPERCGWFYDIIASNVLGAVSCTIIVEDLVRAIDTAWWTPYIKQAEKLKNPYYFAFIAIMDLLRQHQHAMGLHEPIDFVFDNDSEKAKCLDAWATYEQIVPAEKRKHFGSTPIFRDDETTLPLQAADLIAYWTRQWEEDGIADGIVKLRFPWEAKKEIPWFSMRFAGNDFVLNLNSVMWQTAYRKKWGWLC